MILKRLFGRKKNRDDWDYADDVLEGESQPSSGIATADSQDHDLLNGIKARVKAYADYNARKISTIISKLGDLDKEIFTVLPALVHLNLPGLPGFISNRELAPDGIVFFKISDELPNLIKSLFPKAKIPTRNFVRPKGKSPIYSLAAMGSLGTIAQTAKSDLDIWVCVKKPEFTKEQLDALAHKLQEIEKWAEKKNHFECHFFITDIDEARENHFGESDSESAGSALGKLLKEEFYRTHTVLAGVPPLWTVMPPHISDEEYERLSRIAPERYAYDPIKYIDLGNAQRVSMEEAFGAALWQLNKALRSPFKSAIKMALIENYMDPHSEPTLLCDNLKENLTNLTTQFHKDKFKTDALGPGEFVDDHPNRFELDGYLLMFNRILEYYRRKGREDLQEILRQCFYLKAGDTITGIYDPMRQKNLKKDMLGELIEGWGWNNDHILDLNAFKEWPFERSVELGRQINNFIVDSYKRLSQSGTTSNVKINENDLTVLGRKLFTFYSRKDKKVEYLPRSFEESLHQDQITFSMIPSRRGGEGIWRVHRGSVAAAEINTTKAEGQLLRQSRNLPELLIWLVMNGIWDRSTQIRFQAKESTLTAAYVQDILETMLDFFPSIDVGYLTNEELIQNSKVRRLFAILNFGDPNPGQEIRRLDLVYCTSWGEYYTERPTGNLNKTGALRFCLDRLPHGEKEGTPNLKVYTPSRKTGLPGDRRVYVDFEDQIQKITDFFHSTPLPAITIRSYILKSPNGIVSFSWNGKEMKATQFNAFEEFFRKQETGHLRRVEIGVAPSNTDLVVAQAVTNQLQLNLVQIFTHDIGGKVRVYISDEMGGTIYISMAKSAWPAYAAKLGVFLSSTVEKLAVEPWRVKAKMAVPKLAFYHIVSFGSQNNQFQLKGVTMDYLQSIENEKVKKGHVHVSEKMTKDGKRGLVFEIDGKIITSLQHGDGIFRAVAEYMYNFWGRKKHISIFSLSLPLGYRKKHCPRGAKTYHFFIYKNLLERKLNEAMNAL